MRECKSEYPRLSIHLPRSRGMKCTNLINSNEFNNPSNLNLFHKYDKIKPDKEIKSNKTNKTKQNQQINNSREKNNIDTQILFGYLLCDNVYIIYQNIIF